MLLLVFVHLYSVSDKNAVFVAKNSFVFNYCPLGFKFTFAIKKTITFKVVIEVVPT